MKKAKDRVEEKGRGGWVGEKGRGGWGLPMMRPDYAICSIDKETKTNEWTDRLIVIHKGDSIVESIDR